jgi:hypothetical protein
MRSRTSGLIFGWWLPLAVLALITAEVLYQAIGLTNWSLLSTSFGVAAVISAVVLRALGRTLFASILITAASLIVVAALFALYAHHVSNSLN